MSAELLFANRIIPPTSHNLEVDHSFEKFQQTPFKFALQKGGELTEISLSLLEQATEENLSDLLPNAGRKLFTTLSNDIGIALARNKAICQLVAHGSVDAGIVGLDQVFESGLQDNLVIISEFRELGEWDIVLATPRERMYKSLGEIFVIATQYPVIAQAFFQSVSLNPEIIPTHGSTEVMPLLSYGGNQIDGIVDLRVSGSTLDANGMEAWNPAITTVFPVLVANQNSLKDPTKVNYLEKFMRKNT